jgi:hypothetical protein
MKLHIGFSHFRKPLTEENLILFGGRALGDPYWDRQLVAAISASWRPYSDGPNGYTLPAVFNADGRCFESRQSTGDAMCRVLSW